VDEDTRYDMYSYLLTYLEHKYDYTNVGLCKETIKMWERLGLDYKKIKCNCIL